MEKPWHPQQSPTDAPVALLKSMIQYIGFPVSRSTIEQDLKKHPEFPLLSFEAIVQILERWGLKAAAYSTEVQNLSEVPPASILFVHEQIGNIKAGIFVMLHEVKENTIEYLHPRKGWVIEEINEFSNKWSKAAISLIEQISEGEFDYELKEKDYEEKKLSNPDLKNLRVKDNFLTDEECDYIIKLANPVLKRSTLMGEQNIVDQGRTSYSAEFHVFPYDEILNGIRKRASELLNIPETHFEFFQCVSYEPKQEYQNHYDTFDENSERGRKAIEEGGQRKYTMLVYLNDDFTGGATYFPNVDIIVHPKKKRVVIFNNLDDEGKVIKAAYHAGLPVTKGRKYAINIWVREKSVRN